MSTSRTSSDHSGRQLLFVTPILSFPPRGGPEIRVWNTLQAMARIQDLSVSVVHLAKNQNVRGVTEGLQGIFGDRFGGYFPLDFRFQGLSVSKASFLRFLLKVPFIARPLVSIWVIERVKKNRAPLAVWFSFGNISSAVVWGFHLLHPAERIVYDTDSIWSRYLRRTSQNLNGLEKFRVALSASVKHLEEVISSRICDVTVAVSEVDAEHYRAISGGRSVVQVVANVVDDSVSSKDGNDVKTHTSESLTKTVLITGTFGFRNSPMDFGTDWFVREVWPKVKQAKPQTKLILLGKEADRMWGHISSTDVEVVGSAEDFSPYFQRASVSAVPLWFESGTRIKILQAGVAKLPVVSTSLGAEGLVLDDEAEILIADDADRFAASIVRLVEDESFAESIASGLHDKVVSHYGIGKAQEQVEEVLRHCE